MEDIFGAPEAGSSGRQEPILDLGGAADASPAFGDVNPFDDDDDQRIDAGGGLSSEHERAAQREAERRAQQDADMVAAGLDDFVPDAGSGGGAGGARGGDNLDEWYQDEPAGGQGKFHGGGSGGPGALQKVGALFGRFRDWVVDSTGPAIFFILSVIVTLGSLAIMVMSIVQFVPTVPQDLLADGATPDVICQNVANTTAGEKNFAVAGGGQLQPVRFIFSSEKLDGQILSCGWHADLGVPRLLMGLGGGLVGALGIWGAKTHKKLVVWIYVLLAAVMGGAFFYEMCVDAHAVDISSQTCNVYGKGGDKASTGLLGNTGSCAMMPFVITCLMDAGAALLWFATAYMAQRHVRTVMGRVHGHGVV